MAATHTTAIVLKKTSKSVKPWLHDLVLETRPVPQLRPGQILVRMNAVALNHRDLWIRKGQYPGIAFDSILGADGAGVVVASADGDDPLVSKRVFLVPMRGWESGQPANNIPILGGIKAIPIGTFSQYVAVERDQVIESPDHVDDEHIAAWPLAGVTAWRAAVVNAGVKKGDNVLITGIGGGVALTALQICVALGANVYVTSSSKSKMRKATELGAKGAFNYSDKDWTAKLAAQLAHNGGKEATLDSVIDSGGGQTLSEVNQRLLRPGGKFVVYGMTATPVIKFTMREVLKNHQLIGSTMGSRQDLCDATRFLVQHKIVPVVSHILPGLESAETGFSLMEEKQQCGKIVLRIRHNGKVSSKL